MTETEEQKKKRIASEEQKRNAEMAVKPDYQGTSTQTAGNTQSLLNSEKQMLELPAGIKAPSTFRIPDQTMTTQGGANSTLNVLSDKKVSSTDYYNYQFDAENKTRVARGESPLTLAEKNQRIIDSIINSPQNTMTSEYQANVQSGKIQLGNDNTAMQQQAQQLGQPAAMPQQTGQANQQLTAQQIQNMTPAQQQALLKNANINGVDLSQALGAGAVSALPGIAGGVAVGSLGAGIGAVPGAILGGVGAFIVGFMGNLRKQKSENVTAEYSNLPKSTKTLRYIITDTNGGGNVSDNIIYFNEQLALIDEAHSKLYLETRGNLSKFLGADGTVELENFENYYSAGGAREYLIREMQQAVLNPNPSKSLVNLSDVTED